MIDTSAVIDACDINAVLSELGVDTERRESARGYELYFHCFNPGHDDTTRKMSISDDGKYKGLFNCWACGLKGNLVQAVQYLKHTNYQQALLWLSEHTGVGELDSTESLIYQLKKDKLNYGKEEVKEEVKEVTLPESFRLLESGDSQIYRSARKYCTDRNISPATTEKYAVGISRYGEAGWWLTIPIKFRGTTRSIFYCELKDGGKKRYPKGSPQGQIIFNYDEALAHGEYIMVESILDVLTIDSAGYGPAVACFTNMITDSQLKLLRPFPIHRVMPDRDSNHGWDLVTRMVAGLDKSLEVALVPLGKDPGDCVEAELRDAFLALRRYSDIEVDSLLQRVHNPVKTVDDIKKK